MSIELGDKVRDRITGFLGIAVAITTWLNGCVRAVVQSQQLDKDGEMREPVIFDVEDLDVVKAGAVKAKSEAKSAKRQSEKQSAGGPMRGERATARR